MLAKVRLFSFIMLHLLTVNLCIWVEAAIEKVSHTIKGKHEIENYTMNTDHQKTSITGYFLPAVSEYCAIAVAVIYEMSQRIGQLKQIVAHHECPEEPSKTSRLKSCTGPIFGVFLSMLILVLILILEMAGNAIDGVRTIIHLSEISSIHVMALLFCILGIAYVKRLKFSVNFAKSSLDEKLLLVTFFLAVNFFVVSIVLCIAYLTCGLLTIKEMEYMAAQLISTLLELIQAMVQTYFIHDMFYRCCHHKIYQQTKPGRTVIVILSALNFSLWMIYSFQVKHNDVLFRISWNKFQDADLRGLHMFVTVVLPMVMLFRYHSSVCLAISFVRIYEDEVTRYESMLRWLKQGTTRDFLHKLDLHLENSWMANEQGPPKISNSARDQLQPGRTRSISQPILKSQLRSTKEPVNGNGNKTNTSECGREKPREEKRIDPSRTRRDTQANFEMALIRVAAREAGHRMTEHRLRQHRLKECSSPTAQEDSLGVYREPVRFYTGDNMEGISEITSEEDTSHSVVSATPKHQKNRNETNR
ncbi:uncharacterized protein DEA37_0005650 [Paragonimus westermani]|uniref:Otopetrin n=1 Tax=Paragonimus westermani TaxID=34504 RepID=A0A5J4NC21_9TREM|nr:uncharacterized protein DEA37_0005650 [Paragonimus westermani]